MMTGGEADRTMAGPVFLPQRHLRHSKSSHPESPFSLIPDQPGTCPGQAAPNRPASGRDYSTAIRAWPDVSFRRPDAADAAAWAVAMVRAGAGRGLSADLDAEVHAEQAAGPSEVL